MKWAVAYMDYDNHELTIEIVEASDWRQALKEHPAVSSDMWNTLPSDIGDAKSLAFEQDWNFDVVQIEA